MILADSMMTYLTESGVLSSDAFSTTAPKAYLWMKQMNVRFTRRHSNTSNIWLRSPLIRKIAEVKALNLPIE